MIRLSFCLLLAGLSISTLAQDKAAIKYAGLLTPEGGRKHLSILASDKFEGRETGKKGAEMAANYIAEEFKKLGLKAPVKGSYFQEVGLVESRFEIEKFQVNGTRLENMKDFYFNAAGPSKKIKAEEIVFAGYGISADGYDDLKGQDITGKVVMIMGRNEPQTNGVSVISKSGQPSEWTTNRAKRFQNLRSKKPAIILSVNPELSVLLGRMGNHKTEASLALKGQEQDPDTEAEIIQITPEAADIFLKDAGVTLTGLTGGISQTGQPGSRALKTDIELVYGTKHKDVKASNVLGYLEGTDKKSELLVVSAHYDHVGMTAEGTDKFFNGADDDGSGTSAVLELARVFSRAKKEGKGPRRSILFLAVVGEEKGLLGSEWYSKYPVFPLANTVTNLNIDMIGRVDPAHKDSINYCYLIGSDKLSTDLHKISEHANATYTKLKIDYKYNDPKDPERIYYRSDHYNFAKHNIPIIFYFNGVHEDYHKVSDEISKINFPLWARRTKLVFHTAWEIANREKRPVVDVTNDMPQSR